LARSKHLTDDDQIPISDGNDSAIGNLEGCLRQHPGGTAFMVGMAYRVKSILLLQEMIGTSQMVIIRNGRTSSRDFNHISPPT
jgi:hypothetical protein